MLSYGFKSELLVELVNAGGCVCCFPIFSPTAVCDHKWDSQRKIPWNIIEQLVVPLSPNPLITLSR
jgi:hypothetical protein